jgi:hypothetical protein
MSTYKELSPGDIKTSRTFMNQLVDIPKEDISGSVSRKKYQHFVTGGVGPGVTSSLWQTVYDQNFNYQTANGIFDITFGLYPNSSVVSSSKISEDSAGKPVFPSSSLMMREKMQMYQQFASTLLGDSDAYFTAPFDSSVQTNRIDTALILSFKRLFSRDQIARETFAMQYYQSASSPSNAPNLYTTSLSGSTIYTDVASTTTKLTTFGGQVGNLIDAGDPTRYVGNIFYDRGIVVLDMNKILSGTQHASGTIDAVSSAGTTGIGTYKSENPNAKMIPDFVVSGSIDNVIDHICGSHFGSGSNASITFQNQTSINSTLIFCRAEAGEFNYSSNPTYTDSDSRIVVIDEGQEDSQQAFSYITTVGLFGADDTLLAVAKLSRPLEKNPERDASIRVRLDY